MKSFYRYFLKNYPLWLILCSSIPVSMTAAVMFVWAPLYLSECGYFLPIQQTLPFYLGSLLLVMGVLVSCWGSDKFFFGTRWFANIFLQIDLAVLLLCFWLLPGNIVVMLYPYLKSGVLFFVIGLLMSIVIAAIDLTHQGIFGISVGSIVIFLYIEHILCSNMLSGMLIEYLGWNYYFTVLIGCNIIFLMGLWHYKKFGAKRKMVCARYYPLGPLGFLGYLVILLRCVYIRF